MSARVAIAAGYFPAYARLPRKAQRKADEFIRKFSADPTQASIHYEPIRGAVDRQLHSVRIGDDYRAIVRAPDAGRVFVLLWVDHHDEAYRWAESKQLQIHPVTGTLQVFDVDAASRVVTEVDGGPSEPEPEVDAPEYEEKRLFSDFTDDQLFAGGLPRPLIPAVRALYTHTDLDRLTAHLPQEAADLLTGLAAGYSYDAVLEQILDTPPTSPDVPVAVEPRKPPTVPPAPDAERVDPIEVALGRESTQREFRLLDGSFDLDKALSYPLDVWRVYLHPSQRKVARARTKGPLRVTGGAGTGKTVVVMHRAAFLVREVFRGPDDRILVTTYTRNLAYDIHEQLGKLLEPEELARIEVVNIDAWANQYLKASGHPLRLATNEARERAWRSALDLHGIDGFDHRFCKAEWECVIQEQNLRDELAYGRAIRKHRGVPLSRPDRRRLWAIFEEYRAALASQGVSEATDILRAARERLEAKAAPSAYRSVIVDEAQDFGVEALRLVRAIAGPEHPDDLFLVGDAHQRIYGRPTPLSQCGINIRGRRSRELRINYRTTAAICRWAHGILGTGEFDDLDEGKVRGRGYVSLRAGEKPIVRHFADQAEERAFVVSEIQTLLAEGILPESICVVARLDTLLSGGIGPALAQAGIDTELLGKTSPRSSSVRLATMHRVKGLEFRVVFVISVDDGILPLASMVESDDPVVAEQALARERCLLYVAASRARDSLYVVSHGTRSPFLEGIDEADVASTRDEARAHTIPPKNAPPATQAEPEATVKGAVDGQDLSELLDQSVDILPLPARMLNWCARAGIATVRELVAHAPVELVSERNLGRKTIAETRALLEARFGGSWEEVGRFVRGEADPGSEGTALEVRRYRAGWDRLRPELPPAFANVPISEVGLPARMVSYCTREGIETLGQLAKVERQVLVDVKNLGRGTLAKSLTVIADFIENTEARHAAWSAGLLSSWKGWMRDLDPIPRMILARRAGLAGAPETLDSIGETLGVTRERIRQIEVKHTKELQAQARWRRFVHDRFRQRLESGGAVPVEELETDPWWAGIGQQPQVLRYLCKRLLDDEFSVVNVGDIEYLAAVPQAALDQAWSRLVAAAEAEPLPAPLERFEAIAHQEAAPLGPALATALYEQLQDRLQLDDPTDPHPTVLAFGIGKRSQIIALLAASETPLPITDLIAKVGRFRPPDEVLYFDRGVVGLKQHFPEFQRWQDTLVPVVVSIITDTGPDRQWSCWELIEDVREVIETPEWLGPWHLASLLRSRAELTYLGRLRVALPGVIEEGGRVLVREHLLELLQEAGSPVDSETLFTSARRTIDFNEVHARLTLLRPPFLKCDDDTWGLMERDLPGGTEAADAAIDHIETALQRRERGLTGYHLQRLLQSLSATHAQWTQAMCLSVLRSSPTFRFSQSGNVGLAEWETVRAPSRTDLVAACLKEGNGRVSFEAVQTRLEALYGTRPTRADVTSMALKVGGRLAGEWVVLGTGAAGPK